MSTITTLGSSSIPIRSSVSISSIRLRASATISAEVFFSLSMATFPGLTASGPSKIREPSREQNPECSVAQPVLAFPAHATQPSSGTKSTPSPFLRWRSMSPGGIPMEKAQIGWIAAIIIGGLAGWLAEMFMKSGTGILMNIILGIVSAALANWLFGLLGLSFGGWLGYLVMGFIGACIIIFLWRALRTRTA